jgi:outer membrane protein OmpA-like peptidoglycan-associated protein
VNKYCSFLFLWISLSIASNTFAQDRMRFNCNKTLRANDVVGALDVKSASEVQIKCRPHGSGKHNETASGRVDDTHYFEEEHNIIWIKFVAQKGDLNIRIVPDSTKDDYDFLLFEQKGENFLQRLKVREVAPVRTNLARSQGGDAETGLNNFAKENFVGAGKNEVYSNAFKVEDSTTFYLALDNVYDNGGGATVYFNSFQSKEISGVIRDENNAVVPGAEVTWEDAQTGLVLNSTKADKKTGEFKMVVVFEPTPENTYTLASFSKGHFFDEQNYTGTTIENCSPEPIEMVLPKLEKGRKFTVTNIHFRGNVALFIISAYPSLRRLAKLMKQNKSLYIMIEGHTNGASQGSAFSQKLSDNRSLAVETYLGKRDVDIDRIETSGKGASEMLYPITSSPKKQQLNRRVEILVLDY